MRERDMELMEEMLQEDLPLSETVTPWGRAMRQILWGIGLTALTLNWLYLQYILPSVGVILLVLGFRTLSRENKWMRCGWIVSVLRAAWQFFAMAVLALGLMPERGISWVGVALVVLQTVCLWRGLAAVRAKAGQEPKASAGGWLLVWEIVMIPLALMEISGWLAVLPLLVVYILILFSLRKLSHAIDEAGYVVEATPVRVSTPTVLWGYLGSLAVAVALCLLLGGRYPMDWAVKETTHNAAAEVHLRELGMPEEMLDDLSPEHKALLADAISVHAGDAAPGNTEAYVSYGEADPLQLRTVIAELPAEKGRRWVVLHTFRWSTGPAYHGTDCLVASPWFEGNIAWLDEALTPSGRVLCEKDGVTLTASFHAVKKETYTYGNLFGSNTRCDTVADFTPLRGGTNLRGYLLYGLVWDGETAPDVGGWGNVLVQYYHQSRPDFPALDARAYVRQSGGSSQGAYTMGVDIIHHPFRQDWTS